MAKAPASKEAMYDFLKTGIAMMNSDVTRELLKGCEEPGQKLIELQREGWDVHGIDRDLGCQSLDSIQQSDKELFSMRQTFVHTAMRTFVRTVEDRKPSVLDTKGKIPRASIIKFFDTCNTKLDLPETQEMLMLWTKENKQMPNELIVNMQKDMLESIGFEREHGCRTLSSIGDDFPGDQHLFSALMQWKSKAEQTCRMVVKVANGQLQQAGHMPGPGKGAGKGVPITEIIQQQLNASPEMKALAEKAKEEVAGMAESAKEEHIEKMQAKMEVMMKLPPGEREEAMKKNQDINKYDVVKSQVIMMSKMDQKKTADGMQELATTGSGSAPAPAPKSSSAAKPAISVPTTAAPGQMTM